MKASDSARWFDTWAAQLASAQTRSDLRQLHRWLWSDWTNVGSHIAAATNTALRLLGDDRVQPDLPHLFAGRPGDADVLFVNINPGWNVERNDLENKVVSSSEEASWSFCRALFTRYQVEVGPLKWWSQAIGVAWRIMHGSPPTRKTAQEKREWANAHVSGFELLPIHSSSAGFLGHLMVDPVGPAIRAAMSASLSFAIRCGAPITIVASRIGASLTEELAAKERWREIKLADAPLPGGLRAFQVHGQLVLTIPRQFVSKYSGMKFEDIATAVSKLRNKEPS